MFKAEFRVGLVNGKFGYGASTWEALVNAVGTKKAELITNMMPWDNPLGFWYAKNGNLIATVEVRKTYL